MSIIENEIDLELFWTVNNSYDLLDYSSIFTNEISPPCAPSAITNQKPLKITFPESRPCKQTYFAIRKVAKTKRSDDLTPSKLNESDLDPEELKYMSNQEKLEKMRVLSRQVKKYKCILENISRNFDDKVEKIFKRKISETTRSAGKSKKANRVRPLTLRKVIKALRNIKYSEIPGPFDNLIDYISKGKEFLNSLNFKTICQEVRNLKNSRKHEKVSSLSLNSLNETAVSKRNSEDELENNKGNCIIDFGVSNNSYEDNQSDYNLKSDFYKQDCRFDEIFNFGFNL